MRIEEQTETEQFSMDESSTFSRIPQFYFSKFSSLQICSKNEKDQIQLFIDSIEKSSLKMNFFQQIIQVFREREKKKIF